MLIDRAIRLASDKQRPRVQAPLVALVPLWPMLPRSPSGAPARTLVNCESELETHSAFSTFLHRPRASSITLPTSPTSARIPLHVPFPSLPAVTRLLRYSLLGLAARLSTTEAACNPSQVGRVRANPSRDLIWSTGGGHRWPRSPGPSNGISSVVSLQLRPGNLSETCPTGAVPLPRNWDYQRLGKKNHQTSTL